MSTPGEMLEALGREARARLGGGRGEAEGVRVFRGRSVEELIPQIEAELGADAMIVRRREGLSGGVLGFFQHPYIEIEAIAGTPRFEAYDDVQDATPEELGPPPPQSTAPAPPPPQSTAPAPPPPQSTAPAPYQPAPPASQPPPASSPPPPSYAPPAPVIPPAPAALTPPPPPAAPPAVAPAVEPDGYAASPYVSPQLAALARAEPPQALIPPRPPQGADFEFQELLASAPARPAQREPPEIVRAPPPPIQERRTVAPPVPERRTVAPGSQGRARSRVERSLTRYGISEGFAAELLDEAAAHTLPLSPRAGLAQAVLTTLARRIPVAPPLPVQGALVVLVGPGGAGKTTCCVTLLGAYRAASTLPASYASLAPSADGEQLQMILSPQIVKPTSARAARAKSALRRARREGMAIVDTPAVSPAERTRVRELARWLGEIEPDRVVVALPATLGATAAAQLLSALEPLKADALAVTHADETDQLGVAVEAACRHGLAPEYMLERSRGGGWLMRRVDPADLVARMLP
ncbi:MAG: AAA family ATPase [Solirubrobacteraceae bacterium]